MSTAAFAAYARYYDLLYRDKNYATEAGWVDAALRAAGATGGRLLDVGCGTGMHAREFRRLGWQVCGVDLSPRMIELARRKTAGGDGVEFFEGRAADFAVPRRFAAAVSLFHVASYQAGAGELAAMCVNVRRHLEAGAAFVFDFWHAAGVRADPPAVRERRLAGEGIRVRRVATPTHWRERSRIDVHYRVEIDDGVAGCEVIEETHRMRYFTREEVEAALTESGFTALRWHAGLADAPLTENDWYGLVVARVAP